MPRLQRFPKPKKHFSDKKRRRYLWFSWINLALCMLARRSETTKRNEHQPIAIEFFPESKAGDVSRSYDTIFFTNGTKIVCVVRAGIFSDALSIAESCVASKNIDDPGSIAIAAGFYSKLQAQHSYSHRQPSLH